jgi:hypothetical protein
MRRLTVGLRTVWTEPYPHSTPSTLLSIHSSHISLYIMVFDRLRANVDKNLLGIEVFCSIFANTTQGNALVELLRLER